MHDLCRQKGYKSMSNKQIATDELSARRNRVGGQAVLEGVMMRAGSECATACRKPDGTIAVDRRSFVSIRKKHKFLDKPILRGIVNFIEMLILSFKTLTRSAEIMGVEEGAEESRFEKWIKKHLGVGFFDMIMAVAAVLGVVLCLFLFMYVPNYCANWISSLLAIKSGLFKAFIEGVMKVAVFILYIVLVSFMKDIRRTFEYHGAEHKTIACFEAGEELTPENAKKHCRLHPRCGTSFLFVMILLGIVIGLFVHHILPGLPSLLYVLIRLLLLPLVVGLGYEFIMYAGTHDHRVIRILSKPGLWMQQLTTKEPDDAQLEVAIIATKCAMPDVFPDFDPTPYLDAASTEEKEDAAEEEDSADQAPDASV